ncbi:MAG TPA: PDZ domain-containing protein [Steroidobacteraceae bacterium]|nr:PDZ domain-containing protein [Steroidobacteraceae bacterium]
MSRCPLFLAWSLVLMTGTTAVSCRPTIARAELPAAAGSSRSGADGAVRAADEGRLEQQLDAARKELDEAAHRVAELSAQLSRPVIESFMDMDLDGHGRAIIGVQLEATAGQGARVREVSPGGPAAEAGIRAGDVIVSVNGTEVKGENPARQVMRLMRAVKPDSKVSVRVLRDGSGRDFTVVARAAPGDLSVRLPDFGPDLMPGPRWPLLLRGPVMDMELATVTPQLGRYFGSEKGVLVVRAPADGALKLEDGDVILAIDGREPSSGSHATRILSSYQPGEKITLRIVRMHKTLDLDTTLPARPEHRHAAAGGNHLYLTVPPVPQVTPAPPSPPLLPVPPGDEGMVLRAPADQT